MRHCLWILLIVAVGVPLMCVRIAPNFEIQPLRLEQPATAGRARRYDDGRVAPRQAVATRSMARRPSSLPRRYDDGRTAPAEATSSYIARFGRWCGSWLPTTKEGSNGPQSDR